MSSPTITLLKQKQADGTFKKFYPVTSLDSILINENTKLSSKLTNNGDNYSGTAANASAVPWAGVTNKPTTVKGYGITDAVSSTDLESINITSTSGANSVVQRISGTTSVTTTLDFNNGYPSVNTEYLVNFEIPEDEANVVVNLYGDPSSTLVNKTFTIQIDGVQKSKIYSFSDLTKSTYMQTDIYNLTKGIHTIVFVSTDGATQIPLTKIVIRGKQSNVTGEHSTGLGRYQTVTGENSMAVNYNNIVEAENAFAANSSNRIEPDAKGSFVTGHCNIAKSTYQTIAGTYSGVDADDAFVIGNGSSDTDRRNAFKVDKKGKTIVSGELIAGPYYSFNKDTDAFVIGNGSSDTDRRNAFKVTKTGDVTIGGSVHVSGDINPTRVNCTGINARNISVSNNLTVTSKISCTDINVQSGATIGTGGTFGSGVINNRHASFGNNTVTGAGSSAFGGNNKVYGEVSFAAITSNTIPDTFTHVFIAGHANTATSSHQVIFGTYADPQSNDQFVIGNGNSSLRKNAFAVSKTGDLRLGGTKITLGSTELSEDKLKELTTESTIKLDANGKISIENLPHGALERCVVVTTEAAKYALTKDQVQTGDTVKVRGSGMMYFVVDDNKLSKEAGYEVYTAGSATSVPWNGVTYTPTTLSGYGITDAVKAADVVTSPSAGKILKLDSTGKFPSSAIPQSVEFITYTEADMII